MQEIEIVGARKNNLKEINLNLPKRQLITITGVSGSGKSTLAYDTIFQEGQRRYLESLSLYARQFIKAVEKPEVQRVRGISPTISIDQKHASFYYHSTVGTISGISPYLRLLFARASQAFCPGCGKKIARYSFQKILDYVFEKFSGQSVYFLAPLVKNRKGNHQALFERYRKRGFLKARVDGQFYYLDAVPALDRNRVHDISVLIDGVKIGRENEAQIKESISLSGFESSGEIIVLHGQEEYFFSDRLYCPRCHISLKEPQPATFSLHSPGPVCPDYQGTGFNREALAFYFGGKNIFELGEMEIADLADFFGGVKLGELEQQIVAPLMPQIIQRLEAFIRLHLGYITLNRRIETLSGGELQRTRLVSQLGFGLAGIIYILDEPSIGLHVAEQESLIAILQKLKEKDNTVIVVEHDESTIRAADYVVDMGPGAGSAGGRVVYAGWLKDFFAAQGSLTADYLSGKKRLPAGPSAPGWVAEKADFIEITGLTINNVRDADLRIPLGALTAVTGVSGSGKSSLIMDAFYPLVRDYLAGEQPGKLGAISREIRGLAGQQGKIRVLTVDQAAIGKNSHSCPATYIGLMPGIRELFAGLLEAKIRGYGPSRFSFNVPGGRCEACRGLGFKRLEMSFLPRLEVTCPVCDGKRYHSETLLCKYKGYSIADVLDLTAAEAYTLFRDIPYLAKKIKVVLDVGLGYLKLGQGSTSLSGGESQRIRLSRELGRAAARPTIYLLDEPTVGLHFADIERLIQVCRALIARGQTVVVIEHNLDIIRAADYIVDLGPGGGRHGGKILFQGGLPGISACPESITGRYITHSTEVKKPHVL